MLCAILAALGESAGVLNAASLAGILRSAETLPICAVRILEQCKGQTQQRRHNAQCVLKDASHSVACAPFWASNCVNTDIGRAGRALYRVAL